MNTLTNEVLDKVKTRKEAEEIVAALLLRFTGNTAFSRIKTEAETSKQSTPEATRRAATNLFARFSLHK